MGRFIYIILFMMPLQKGNTQAVFNPNTVASGIVMPEEEINTASFEFSPVFFGQYIGFVYDKGNSKFYDEVHDTPYFDLAFAAKNTVGNLVKKASFPTQLSSAYQDGPFCFFNNDSTILFTRTEPVAGLLQIYRSDLTSTGWSDAKKVSLGDKDMHVCHPSVSENGQTLVFAMAPSRNVSNMDLYTATYYNGAWKGIKRLPDQINSDKNDWFPRFVGDSIITFASDREGGQGGLDIYGIKIQKGVWSEPEPAPAPINSEGDDLGLIVQNGISYFSSNRPGSKGKDDLFRMEFKGNLFYHDAENKYSLTVTVKDKLTLSPVREARVSLVPVLRTIDDIDLSEYQVDLLPQESGQGEILMKLKPKGTTPADIGLTDSTGMVTLKLRKPQTYLIELSAVGYAAYNQIYSYEEMGKNIILVMEPQEKPEEESLVIPTTTGSVVVFENIYYDFNSHVIREGAGQELDMLARVMAENPAMVVELISHTDSRGTKRYNQRLSEMRAASARDYLISKDIAPTRIITKGMGESQLRNRCDDNTYCTEEEHSFNRRTEVKIISN